MDKKTLEATKGAIQKWHNVSYHGGAERGADDCPLCKLFHDNYDALRDCCVGCPVFNDTKRIWCGKTPIKRFYRVRSQKNAIAELKYLVCLLPEGESAVMDDGWIWDWK